MKEIQTKYKSNPEKLNQETIELYKREKMSPFSGCLSGILQIIIILSVFWLVSKPLTYMKKINPEIIEKYGSLKGIFLGIIRILKCNPFSKGGYDPLK